MYIDDKGAAFMKNFVALGSAPSTVTAIVVCNRSNIPLTLKPELVKYSRLEVDQAPKTI